MTDMACLYAWDDSVNGFIKLKCNSDGKLIIDPSEIFENNPTDNEHGKAPDSDWAYEHEHNNTDPHGTTLNQTTLNVGTLNITGASRVRVVRGSAQTLAPSTIIVVQYNTEEYDNLNEYDNVTNYRFAPGAAGYYIICASILIASIAWVAGNELLLDIYVNGSQHSRIGRFKVQANFTGYVEVHGTDILDLTASDYLDIRVSHNNSSSINLYASGIYNFLSIHRLS